MNDDNIRTDGKTAVSIQKAILDQTETLAQQLNISQARLIETAVEQFIKNHQVQPHENAKSSSQNTKTATQTHAKQRQINQGEIYWLQVDEPGRSEQSHAHPHVVIQDNLLNRSRINTVVVCALTSNKKRANEPGNVLLKDGEANLPKQSVMVVSQLSTVDKTELGEYIGTLNKQRVNQIFAGMRFQQLSFFARYHAR